MGIPIMTNVDQLLESLKENYLAGKKRSRSLKMLIAEEDKFAQELEQLELAFDRVEKGRIQLGRIRDLRAQLDLKSDARRRTDELLVTIEETQRLLEASYERLRRQHLGNSFNGYPFPQ